MPDQGSGSEQTPQNLQRITESVESRKSISRRERESNSERFTMLPCLKSWQHFFCARLQGKSTLSDETEKKMEER